MSADEDIDDAESAKVAYALGKAAVASFKSSLDDVTNIFNEVEAQCLRLVSSEKRRLEVRRRAAEWKIRLFCDRDADVTQVRKLREEIRVLGYSNIESEASTEIYVAQYYLRQGDRQRAKGILEPLQKKLEFGLNHAEGEELVCFLRYMDACENFLARC